MDYRFDMSNDEESRSPVISPRPIGVLISVADLERSVSFYSDVFDLTVQVRDEQVVILGRRNSDVDLITLREAPRSAKRPGTGTLGPRALFWSVDSTGVLDTIEKRLKDRGAHLRRLQRSENTEIVVGLDPDRLALGFIASHQGRPVVQDLIEVPGLAYIIDV
jgi:catechol 2,3-dioxygenase-like lactoylglutathione lyase family enzyme